MRVRGDAPEHPLTRVLLPRRREDQAKIAEGGEWLQLYRPKLQAYLFFFSSSRISLKSNAITKITSSVASSNNRPGV